MMVPHSIEQIDEGVSLIEVLVTAALIYVVGIAFYYNFFKYALWRQLRLKGYTALRLKGGDE